MTLRLDWPIEYYLHSMVFFLERERMYFHKLKREGIELNRPDHLFKYFSNDKNSLRTIKKGYLYFSHPKNFNDPFDCLNNREKYILQGGAGIKEHRENLGICCFSTINNNPLMWGHYTNHYKGFCIKLRNEELLKNQNIGIHTFVSYLKNYKPTNKEFEEVVQKLYDLENLNNETKETYHMALMYIQNYTWKSYDWSYEKEFRAISWTTDKFQRKLKIKRENLLEIYVGHKMKTHAPKYYEKLSNAIKDHYPECKVFEVKPHPLVVKLEFKEMKT